MWGMDLVLLTAWECTIDGSSCTSVMFVIMVFVGAQSCLSLVQCVDGILFRYRRMASCSDGSKCTIHDVCHAGECRGGCFCPNATCKVGV